MQNKSFRATINSIPKDQSKIKNTTIPLFFNIDFESKLDYAPLITDTLIRCDKCKAYLNPYVEIVMPGYKWICNLCNNVNEVKEPFQMKERRQCENVNDPVINSTFNKTYFFREELRNDIYEIDAPESFNISTTDSPVLCFVIEVTLESQRLGVPPSVLNCISETLKNINYDKRTKIAFMFFNETVYILNNNFTLSAVNGEVPFVLSDKILFSLDVNGEFPVSSLNYEKIEKYFANKKSTNSNYLLALKTAIQVFRSASIFSFISTIPNFCDSKIVPSTSLVCTNNEYKAVAESLVKKNICSNLFIMARSGVELSSLKIPSQMTGGQIFHYSNYDGFDGVSTSKFFSDLSEYFNSEVCSGAVCRIRANEGLVLKNAYGNFYQKGHDLLSYAGFNPAHSINFSIQMYNNVKNALFLQIAMIKVSKMGAKLIRVLNLFIPFSDASFYLSCDSYAIAHALSVESFYYESKNKLSGQKFLEARLIDIWSELKTECQRIPENFYNLPTLVLSLMKGIPLRPDMSTPVDFRVFYMYVLSNSPYKIVDAIIYPLLLNITSENVTPLALTIGSVDHNSIYILDAGINLFFYIGKNVEAQVYSGLFEERKSGPIIFSPPENDFSKYVSELMVFLLENRAFKPRFILVFGNETTVYNDIFYSYMYDDRMYELPGSGEFRMSIDSKK